MKYLFRSETKSRLVDFISLNSRKDTKTISQKIMDKSLLFNEENNSFINKHSLIITKKIETDTISPSV